MPKRQQKRVVLLLINQQKYDIKQEKSLNFKKF